jgi:hypothetical protein
MPVRDFAVIAIAACDVDCPGCLLGRRFIARPTAVSGWISSSKSIGGIPSGKVGGREGTDQQGCPAWAMCLHICVTEAAAAVRPVPGPMALAARSDPAWAAGPTARPPWTDKVRACLPTCADWLHHRACATSRLHLATDDWLGSRVQGYACRCQVAVYRRSNTSSTSRLAAISPRAGAQRGAAPGDAHAAQHSGG